MRNCAEPKVQRLPSLSDSGCPLLAEMHNARRVDKSVVFR